jgi:S-adenosylmethionine-diacylgycerolhomoserine-N-methlytransferase
MSAGPETADHGDLMDRIYRHQRYIYDITRKYYLFGRDRMIRELDLKPGDRLVEVGCGTARNLVRIAKAYPEARLFGLDASHEMLKSAADTVRRAGLEDRITLTHGYAENLAPAMFGETAPFEAALFSYSLSMIPDWKAAINAAARNLAPSGRIHIVDFGDLTGLGGLGRAAMLTWLGLFHVSPRVELLQRLEHEPSAALRLLPGRYAFLFTASALSV